jgi:UDP-N-acetylglucosamine--N-acetylmuramyl-(pentapeptide) pyrophosphoryl-undecaprenol N-acetylglucosamine transferase
VVGGSLGAQALNEAVPRRTALIRPTERPTRDAPGRREAHRRARAALREGRRRGDCVAFIDDMAARYARPIW